MEYLDGKKVLVGDIIRLVDNEYYGADIGTRAIVKAIPRRQMRKWTDSTEFCMEIQWLDDTVQQPGHYYSKPFRLMSRRKKGLKIWKNGDLLDSKIKPDYTFTLIHK